MELDLGPEVAQFRTDTRDWIAQHSPEGLTELTDWNNVVTTGGYGSERRAEAMQHPAYAQWEAELQEARFICPQWPEKFGGKGLDAVRVAIFNEELYRAGVPRVIRGMGESLVGPSIIVHGTPDQQAYFLPRIITGEDAYCQGFSEPGTGSDLAGLQTKGEIDGDEVVITGQKLWTSGAARANKMFVLCRTDPAAEKHAGISFVLIDFKDPAVTYQPVRQMSGAAEFCEDFLDGVRAPMFNVIGGLNNGWRVAMTTLGYERGGQRIDHAPGLPARVLGARRDRAQARQQHRPADPAEAGLGLQPGRDHALRGPAGPGASWPRAVSRDPEASINKLFWSEYHKKLGEIAMDIEGTDALIRPEGDGYADHRRGRTSSWPAGPGSIYSGTNEIQRNIIAERALGLPKEPRVKA